MKQAKYSLNLSMIILLVVLCVVSSAAPSRGNTQKPDQPTGDKRKYSPMPVEEARKLVEKHIKNNDVPSRPLSSWKLPESGLYAQGIKINDNDYIIFAHVEPNEVLRIFAENLSEFIPKIGKNYTNTSATPEIRFLLNGIIFSTVDFKVVNNPTFTRNERLYCRAKQVIEKGGYTWYIGAVGILLKQQPSSDVLIISFEEPITGFSKERNLIRSCSIYFPRSRWNPC